MHGNHTTPVNAPHLSIAQALGLAVRTRREQSRLSQEAFAYCVGVHRTYVGSVERGERNLTLNNIYAFADALGISGSQLLAEAEDIRNGASHVGTRA